MEKYLTEEFILDSYLDLCKFLQNKYGIPKGNYFLTKTCKSPNAKIKRTKEGLFIHHIKENEAVLLSETKGAIIQPFEYQQAENLCYCNYLEHLILHYKIFLESMDELKKGSNKLLGIQGIVCKTIPEINDYFNGYNYKSARYIKSLSLVDQKSFEELKKFLWISINKIPNNFLDFKMKAYAVLILNKGIMTQ
jgi:hypothetical protein